MNEREFIQLHTLLSKLRVEALKKMSNKNNSSSEQYIALKVVRNIDYIKNHPIIHFNDRDFINKKCSKCANKYNDNDLCCIRKNIDGHPQCVNFRNETDTTKKRRRKNENTKENESK